MNNLISTRSRRLAWAALVFILVCGFALYQIGLSLPDPSYTLTDGEFMNRLFVWPGIASIVALVLLTACANRSVSLAASNSAATPAAHAPTQPFRAQVVGVQWLNPLQRRDYPTEWQLLWTLGLVKPNKDDDMVRTEPALFSKLQAVGSVAAGNEGSETFKGYHHKYIEHLIGQFHDIYFSDSTYFYNAHSLKDKSTWRELAGIHVEYALPEGKLDPVEAGAFAQDYIRKCFQIGNPSFPTTWSRATPPDVRVTMGGPNAGFTSLSAALDYLQSHPDETVWAMNWDAPSRPKDDQINENMVLLVLAGPNYKTERHALAWIGYPASHAASDFDLRKDLPPRKIQAWQATVNLAATHAGKTSTEIGYVIHDANNTFPDSSDRIGALARTLSTEVVEFDFIKQSFNTPALLDEMGAGTALTNVALGIAYANHFGKNVLIAGTSDLDHPSAVLVVPPEKVRPINSEANWFRARGENRAYLMWWGLRFDAQPHSQGFSE